MDREYFHGFNQSLNHLALNNDELTYKILSAEKKSQWITVCKNIRDRQEAVQPSV